MAEVPFLPPGPSEEFLRRQAMYAPQLGTATVGSFDPATGERQSQTFDVPVTPPATSELQMMEAIRQQINAMHFKNANDALNAAIRFQHMREAQRMRESGATEQQIWGRLGLGMVYNNPGSLSGIVNQNRPVSVTDVDGAKVLQGPPNTRIVPQSALPSPSLPAKVREIPIEKEDGTISEDEYAVPSASGRGFVVRRRVQKKDSVTPSARLSVLRQQIEGAQKELDSNILKTKKERESPEVQQRTQELKQRIRKAQSDMDAMLTQAPATASDRVTVIAPDGKRGSIPRSQLAEAQANGYKLAQ